MICWVIGKAGVKLMRNFKMDNTTKSAVVVSDFKANIKLRSTLHA